MILEVFPIREDRQLYAFMAGAFGSPSRLPLDGVVASSWSVSAIVLLCNGLLKQSDLLKLC